MDPVVHFEMPYEDRDRLSGFYEKAFGWKMNKLGEEMGNYVVAHTSETDENNMVKTPGTINGGFFDKSGAQAAIPSVVISVQDLHDSIRKIKEAGGTIIGEPMPIPGIGDWVVFVDTEGNRVSILQPHGM